MDYYKNINWKDIPNKGKIYAFAFMDRDEGCFFGYRLVVLTDKEMIKKYLPMDVLINHSIEELGFFTTEKFYQKMNELRIDDKVLIIQAIES